MTTGLQTIETQGPKGASASPLEIHRRHSHPRSIQDRQQFQQRLLGLHQTLQDRLHRHPPNQRHAQNTFHTNPVGTAEVLNKQFQSAFSPTTPLSLKQACQNISPQAGEPHPIMQDIQISKHGIEKLLGNLKPHKAAGPDQIKPIILKELAPSVASMLHIIFQKSLHTGKVPGEWKTADIAPVYKKGNRQVASNYRPISLTCICSKLMQHIVVSSIMSHLANMALDVLDHAKHNW